MFMFADRLAELSEKRNRAFAIVDYYHCTVLLLGFLSIICNL